MPSDLPHSVLYYGEDAPLPEARELRAGPVRLLFENGDLRYLRIAGREILRRVYVAVRDRHWGTVLPRLANLRIEAEAETFRISFDCRHQEGEIDFLWRGTIAGDSGGTITYRMDGVARSTFWRNRIGICVLHPAESAGAPYVVEHPDGSTERGILPREISPHQPVRDIRALTHSVLPGLWAEVRFEGDVFEMEDQRNWTDASFKTYSTPLRLPYPVEIPQGTRVVQSVTLVLHGEVPTDTREPLRLSFRVGTAAPVPVPRLGLGMASHGQTLSAREVERLRALHLAHLRVELVLADSGYVAPLRQAAREARALGVGLEAAVFLSENPSAELATLATHLQEIAPPIDTWLIFRTGEVVTSAQMVGLAREHLRVYAPSAPFGGGTALFFTELNRNRPAPSAFDLACYSVNPQVHAFDNRSLVETLSVQATTVASARHFLGNTPIAITPITLRPRFGLAATLPDLSPEQALRAVDPRQMSLLGAGWTMGSLKYVAESDVARATYFETTGWRGVMETEVGSPQPDRFRSLPGAVFPLYHVFADVGDFAGGQVVPSESSDPLRVEGLALTREGRRRVLLANLTPEACSVVVSGLPARVQVKHLDETNVLHAMQAPEAFRAAAGDLVSTREGSLIVELRPFALARLDGAG